MKKSEYHRTKPVQISDHWTCVRSQGDGSVCGNPGGTERGIYIDSDVDIAELPAITANAVIKIPSVCTASSPIEVDEVILRWVFGKNVHPVFRVLHLPDPPNTINHAVMEPEQWVSRGRKEVL